MEKYHLKYIMTMLIQTPGGEAPLWDTDSFHVMFVCMYVCSMYVCT